VYLYRLEASGVEDGTRRTMLVGKMMLVR
jgi:hypothetical protein